MVEPKRVVITGASSGIGRALASEYARQGATLALIARRGDVLKELAASLPVRSFCYSVDVRKADALSAAGQDFLDRVGCPDVVIANAGISAGTSTERTEDTVVFEEILATNITGMMLTFQPFIDAMRANKRGTLAGIASVAGFRGLPGASAYCASKSAAITYLESLRLELRDSGVKVVTVCPGYINTPLTEVNTYRMPFLLDTETAARSIADAITRGKRFHVLPWQMAIIGWILRRLPRSIYDFAFALAPRKPRRSST
jgi:short-subunit dehydrogenase